MMRYLNFLSVLLIILFSSCQSEAQTTEQITEDVSLEVFQEKIELIKDAQLLDVRRPEEWAEGFIENAIRINWYDEDFEGQIKSLDKEKVVLVYCASGGRSGKAMNLMSEIGFVEVYNLEGGIGAWRAAGLSTTTE